MRKKLSSRLLVLAVASVALVGVGVSPASAAPVADQTQTVTGSTFLEAKYNPDDRIDVGSTFVAGLTGSLTRIDIPALAYSPNPSGVPLDARVRVWSVDTATGMPKSGVLATQVIPQATLTPGRQGTLSTTFLTPATVTAGTTYAFTIGFFSGNTGISNSLTFQSGTPAPDKTAVGIDAGVFTADPTKGISFTTYVDAPATPGAPGAPEAPEPSLAKTGFDGQPFLVLAGGLLAFGVIASGIGSTFRRRAVKR